MVDRRAESPAPLASERPSGRLSSASPSGRVRAATPTGEASTAQQLSSALPSPRGVRSARPRTSGASPQRVPNDATSGRGGLGRAEVIAGASAAVQAEADAARAAVEVRSLHRFCALGCAPHTARVFASLRTPPPHPLPLQAARASARQAEAAEAREAALLRDAAGPHLRALGLAFRLMLTAPDAESPSPSPGGTGSPYLAAEPGAADAAPTPSGKAANQQQEAAASPQARLPEPTWDAAAAAAASAAGAALQGRGYAVFVSASPAGVRAQGGGTAGTAPPARAEGAAGNGAAPSPPPAPLAGTVSSQGARALARLSHCLAVVLGRDAAALRCKRCVGELEAAASCDRRARLLSLPSPFSDHGFKWFRLEPLRAWLTAARRVSPHRSSQVILISTSEGSPGGDSADALRSAVSAAVTSLSPAAAAAVSAAWPSRIVARIARPCGCAPACSSRACLLLPR